MMSVLISISLIIMSIITCPSQSLHEYSSVNKPFFSPLHDSVIHGQVGHTAYLGCEVYNLNNLSVSWIRGRDTHILTVDRETFIADTRFISLWRKEKMSDVVTLSIKEVEKKDEGKYQCQVSSQPKIARTVELVVEEPEVKILGREDIHVKEGSEVVIKCSISNTVNHVPFVSWLFNYQVRVLVKVVINILELINIFYPLTEPSFKLTNEL